MRDYGEDCSIFTDNMHNGKLTVLSESRAWRRGEVMPQVKAAQAYRGKKKESR